MKKVVIRKKITVENEGRLKLLGGVRGPINIPFLAEVSKIGQMVMARYKVIEHLKDGTKVELTLQNYDKENGNHDMQKKVESVVPNKNSNIRKGQQNYTPVIDLYVPR